MVHASGAQNIAIQQQQQLAHQQQQSSSLTSTGIVTDNLFNFSDNQKTIILSCL